MPCLLQGFCREILHVEAHNLRRPLGTIPTSRVGKLNHGCKPHASLRRDRIKNPLRRQLQIQNAPPPLATRSEKIYWLQDQHDHRRRTPAGVVVLPGSRFLSHCTFLQKGDGGPTVRSTSPQRVFFKCLDLHRKSPDSSELQCRSRRCNRRFDPAVRAVGWGG